MKRAIAFILSLMMVLSVLATGLAGVYPSGDYPGEGNRGLYRRMGVLSDCSEGWQNNDPGGNAGNRTSG